MFFSRGIEEKRLIDIPDIYTPEIYVPDVPEPYNSHYLQIASH